MNSSGNDKMSSASKAAQLMQSFAARTGLNPAAVQPGLPRYLWTDSFAVCNYLGLGQKEQALLIIDHVHKTLARVRADKQPGKFLDGATEDHPTRGGLRIGKKMDERQANEEFDEDLEWDRDGQYFHYLTKWMSALDTAALGLQQPKLNIWARELAIAAHRGFVYSSSFGNVKRMYWKMSIDLKRPQVPSMGHHDPLDGLITAMQLQETAKTLNNENDGPGLEQVVEDYQGMIQQGDWSTGDSLGLGGLLTDVYRVEKLLASGRQQISSNTKFSRITNCHALLENLLSASLRGLQRFSAREVDGSPDRRLAFRELGLSLGLGIIQHLQAQIANDNFAGNDSARKLLADLSKYLPLREKIESFWLKDSNRSGKLYKEHEDINDVTLASSIHPNGFLADYVGNKPGGQRDEL